MSKPYVAFLLVLLILNFGMAARKPGDRNSIVIFPQSATTSLSGLVIDDREAIVIGADVVLLNPSTGFQRETTTNAEGVFAFPFLPPGNYQVTVTRGGFAAVVIEGLTLNVNDPRAIRIRLRVGEVHEILVVKADADFRDSPATSTVIDRQFVASLPLNGRSFLPLITLTPGVTPAASRAVASQWLFSANGQRATSNYLMVDGVSANIAASTGLSSNSAALGALPGLTIFGGFNNLVSIDALQEFKVLTSANAPELGRTSGGQISIVTRSGTGKFHGALFNYFRNEALDANDWFANRSGLGKPPLRQNDFGGVLGGPLLLQQFGDDAPTFRHYRRSFFFFSYEGMRVRQPQLIITELPSIILRRNAAARIRPFLDALPVPNGREGRSIWFQSFVASYSIPSSLDATSFRIDHTVNDRLQIFGRYNEAPSDNRTRDVNAPSALNQSTLDTHTMTFGGTFSTRSKLSNDFRLNYSKTRYHNFFTLDSFAGAQALADSQVFPAFASRENSQIGFGMNIAGSYAGLKVGENGVNLQRQLNLVDTFSISTGAHQLKFGIDYRHLSPSSTPPTYTEEGSFQTFSQVVAGTAAWVILSAKEKAEPLFTNFSAFWQDAWKAGRRLTLTYGMRWEVNPSPSSSSGLLPRIVIGLDDPSTMRIAPVNTRLWKTTYNNFAPRLGAVYQISHPRNLETVLRGGIGVFYDLGPGDAAAGFGSSRSIQLSNVLFPLAPSRSMPPALIEPSAISGNLLGIDPDLKLPYSIQWNVAVEQSLGSNQTVSAAYVAALGRRLLNGQSLINPNPSFTYIDAVKNDARSDYHALQVQFQRRLSRGLQTLVGYTWSHSIDLVSDEVQRGLSRGPSDFDMRHVFSAALTYNLPAAMSKKFVGPLLHNWSIDSILRGQTAPPVNVIATNDPVLTGPAANRTAELLRPDLLFGVPFYLKDPLAPGGRRINPAAFAAPFYGFPTVGTRQGTLGRNALRGFPFRQLDLSVRRQFNLTDKIDLQFKADIFNLFNQPNFSSPNTSLYSRFILNKPPAPNPAFGLSHSMVGRSGESTGIIGGLNSLYQAGGPRSIQFSLKLQF